MRLLSLIRGFSICQRWNLGSAGEYRARTVADSQYGNADDQCKGGGSSGRGGLVGHGLRGV